MADIQDSFKAVFNKIENYQKYQEFKEKKVEQLNKKGVAFEQKASNITKPFNAKPTYIQFSNFGMRNCQYF
jgi:hypothetical protein